MTVIFIQMHAFHPNVFFSMHACMLSCFSCVRLCVTLWTVAYQAPLSMGFPWQEYWSVLPCSPPGDLLDPGIEPRSLKSPALPGKLFTTSATCEALSLFYAHFQRFICLLLDDGNSLLSQASLSSSLSPQMTSIVLPLCYLLQRFQFMSLSLALNSIILHWFSLLCGKLISPMYYKPLKGKHSLNCSVCLTALGTEWPLPLS